MLLVLPLWCGGVLNVFSCLLEGEKGVKPDCIYIFIYVGHRCLRAAIRIVILGGRWPACGRCKWGDRYRLW